jgi:hypothetical protein
MINRLRYFSTRSALRESERKPNAERLAAEFNQPHRRREIL